MIQRIQTFYLALVVLVAGVFPFFLSLWLTVEKGIGMLIPVFSIVFLVLSNRAIKKDEDLVKSVDRLR